MAEIKTQLGYVKEVFQQDTGGGITADVIILDDGIVLAITDDAIGLYRSRDQWDGESAGSAIIYDRSSGELFIESEHDTSRPLLRSRDTDQERNAPQ